MGNRKKLEPLKTRFEFETFRRFSSFEEGNLTQKEPSVFNSQVNFRKWRITAEIIDEPKDVLAARLLKLWRECDNPTHHARPLRDAATELGIEFPPGEFGKDRPKR